MKRHILCAEKGYAELNFLISGNTTRRVENPDVEYPDVEYPDTEYPDTEYPDAETEYNPI